MRICLLYDCLFPWTVGGAERWYRALASRLAADGHEVTYLTLRQWERSDPPSIPGVRVIAVGPRMALYVDGRRRILPPLVFGAGVLWHLLRHGRRYDLVQTVSFPYFSLLAAALVRFLRLGRYELIADWFEYWTADYWTSYLGRAGGRVGVAVQALCARVRHRAHAFSHMHAARLGRDVEVLRGIYDGPFAGDGSLREPATAASPPRVVFAGRHIPEKNVPALIPAFEVAARSVPGLALDVFGDGPDFEQVRSLARGVQGVVLHGFADAADVDAALRSATCLVLPSVREGYGLIVVEAFALGVPAVVCEAPDNAAVELVEEGVNGFVAASTSPQDLGEAIVRAVQAGQELRASTARWYAEHATELALSTTLDRLAATYRRA